MPTPLRAGACGAARGWALWRGGCLLDLESGLPGSRMATKPPDAFLSYTRLDEQHDRGAISQFRLRLASAVRAVTDDPFDIFQDVDGVRLGERWPGKLEEILDQARFFVAILTPSYFNSEVRGEELRAHDPVFQRCLVEGGRRYSGVGVGVQANAKHAILINHLD